MKLHQIAQANSEDEEIQAALKYTRHGWPKHIKTVPETIKTYFSEQGFPSESDGLLLHGDRIVIPKVLRSEILSKIHEGHQGFTKYREHAQLCVVARNQHGHKGQSEPVQAVLGYQANATQRIVDNN